MWVDLSDLQIWDWLVQSEHLYILIARHHQAAALTFRNFPPLFSFFDCITALALATYDGLQLALFKAWTQVLHRFKSCSRHVRDSRWWGSLTMVPAGNKAKRLLSVNHTTKTIHHHHHHVWPIASFPLIHTDSFDTSCLFYLKKHQTIMLDWLFFVCCYCWAKNLVVFLFVLLTEKTKNTFFIFF